MPFAMPTGFSCSKATETSQYCVGGAVTDCSEVANNPSSKSKKVICDYDNGPAGENPIPKVAVTCADIGVWKPPITDLEENHIYQYITDENF